MVPYADLPEEERSKDRLFRAVVSALLGEPDPPKGWFTDPYGVRRHGVEQGPPGMTDWVADE
jgi:hypothetical protein